MIYWEQRKLGEVFEEYSEKNHSELPPLTIIQGGGTIRRDESDRALQYDKGSLSNYKMVNKGDFIVHLRSFEGGLEKANSTGIISPAYHTLSGENTDTTFYYAYFRSKKFIESDLKPHVYGIRDGRSIDIEGMKTINIPYTILEEQRRIGKFIDLIDHLITLHQSKSFGHILKAIVSCTLYWEQRKVNDIAETRRGLTYKPNDICEDGIRVLRSSNINEDTFVKREDDVFVDRKAINIPFVQNGDILITSANGSSRLVGKHAIICKITDNSAVHGGFMLLATAKNPQFLNASMGASWYIKFINLFVAGGNGAIGNLNKNDLDEQTILVPCENEQEIIGRFFENLDHLITLHQLEPFQLIFKAIAYRIIDYAKSKPPRHTKYEIIISFIK